MLVSLYSSLCNLCSKHNSAYLIRLQANRYYNVTNLPVFCAGQMMGAGGGFSTLLTLAALHENSGGSSNGVGPTSAGVAAAAAAAAAIGGSVPLPPSMDPHRSLPVTPTTPTSTGT